MLTLSEIRHCKLHRRIERNPTAAKLAKQYSKRPGYLARMHMRILAGKDEVSPKSSAWSSVRL